MAFGVERKYKQALKHQKNGWRGANMRIYTFVHTYIHICVCVSTGQWQLSWCAVMCMRHYYLKFSSSVCFAIFTIFCVSLLLLLLLVCLHRNRLEMNARSEVCMSRRVKVSASNMYVCVCVCSRNNTERHSIYYLFSFVSFCLFIPRTSKHFTFVWRFTSSRLLSTSVWQIS